MAASDAVGGGPFGNEDGRRSALRAVVELTRSVFGAKACSIMRFDAAARELVFEAVAGEGADTLVGRRIPSNTGIAGWSLASEEPISIDDVISHPRFARDVAEQTGYVPQKLTVYPLLYGELSLGVLSVLDAGAIARFGLADMEVLARFASHAAVTLAAVDAARAAEAARDQDGDESAPARLARSLHLLEADQRAAAVGLLEALEHLLRLVGD